MTAPALNLLPWRERGERRGRRIYWLALAACLILPCLLASALNLQARSELLALRKEIRQASVEREAMARLGEQQQRIEGEIDASKGWLKAFERLGERRALVLELWSELSLHLPDSAYYERIATHSEGVLITGITDSSPELASYLRRLEASPSFASPRLIDLEDHPNGHRFSVEADIWSRQRAQ